MEPRQVPRLVWHVVVLELRLYWSLLRWLARRPSHGGAHDEPLTYARLVTPVMWLWIFGSAMELPLVHVLVPWESVRLGLLVIGVWGLLWMVGMLASLWVHPHLLEPARLRVRHGASTDIPVPWSKVAEVTTSHRDLDSSVWTLQPLLTERGTVLQVAVSGQVNVHLTFDEPVPLTTHSLKAGRRTAEYVGLSFFVDEPRDVVARIREHLGPRSPRPRGGRPPHRA